MNMWTTKSKYGATIQTALNYVMGIDPKHEDMGDIFPHVAAVAAAYGDPDGKYAAFLSKKAQDYKDQPFYFYDQSSALPNSPAGQSKRRRDLGIATDKMTNRDEALSGDIGTMGTLAMDVAKAAGSGDNVLDCPELLDGVPWVELEYGFFVKCETLRPYYELTLPVDPA